MLHRPLLCAVGHDAARHPPRPLMSKKGSPYWAKMRRACEQQWFDLHAKTVAKNTTVVTAV
ncbi:hypothetical protein [Streptomyces viridosporus]|uniref:hypothetical protein n=1 Tax=Streptomyces viridosporus TaxID=67581 RepID=UPI00333315C7